MAKQNKLVSAPKLRFPDFREAEGWDLKHGDDLFDAINNRAPAEVLPILAITQEHGAIPRGQINYHVSVTEQSIESYKVVEKGDFIISLRSFQGGIEYSNYRGICSPAYVILRRKGKDADGYFRHLFKSARFIQQLTRNIEGLRDGKMISYKQFSEQLIPVPIPVEQQKIATCLTSLDELIAAQGRKVEALKTYKRGLMQQLFPREGETLPRLRFPEFRDAPPWTFARIGNLLKEVSRAIDMDDTVEYSLVTVKRRYSGVVSRERLKGRAIKVKTQFIVRGGDFLISKRQIVHNACGIVPPELDGAIVSNEYSVLGPKDGCDIEFFNYFAQQPAVSLSFLNSSVGIVIEKMLFKLNTWLNHEFLFPTFEEQRKIAAFLASVEQNLKAESEKLESLRCHKKGLMQQLFPSVEGG
ncbi:MAG: restriction endonuclease subunit S [Thiobacillus sp.]|nr:restriction endonuclease subunit S [Thiobacillus sp.]MDP2977430.1 restriction endonuclease subunit S [Thiobacillus sp.]